MLKKREVTSLITNAIFVKMIMAFPRELVINSGNSAWIQVIYNLVCILLIYYLTAVLYRGNKNIIELSECMGGKPLKIIIGILTFFILLFNFFPIMKIFPESVKTMLIQNTDIRIIILIFAFTALLGAYLGIEAIAKIHYILIPVGAAFLIAFFILLIPYYNIENITPFFGKGFERLFISGFNSISMYSDIILLNILLPFTEKNINIKKTGLKILLLTGIYSLAVVLAYCLTYQYNISERFVFPMYQLSRIIHISSFFSRFEALFQFIWSIMVFLYASLYIYAMCYVLKITFNLKSFKKAVLPVGIIILIVMFIPASIIEIFDYSKKVSMIAYPFSFILPLLFGLYSRKGGKSEIC